MPLSRYFLISHYSFFSLPLLPSQKYHYPEFSVCNNVFHFYYHIYISLNNIEYYFVYFCVVISKCENYIQKVLRHFDFFKHLYILILSSLLANSNIPPHFCYGNLFLLLLCNFYFWASIQGIFIWGQPMGPFWDYLLLERQCVYLCEVAQVIINSEISSS